MSIKKLRAKNKRGEREENLEKLLDAFNYEDFSRKIIGMWGVAYHSQHNLYSLWDAENEINPASFKEMNRKFIIRFNPDFDLLHTLKAMKVDGCKTVALPSKNLSRLHSWTKTTLHNRIISKNKSSEDGIGLIHFIRLHDRNIQVIFDSREELQACYGELHTYVSLAERYMTPNVAIPDSVTYRVFRELIRAHTTPPERARRIESPYYQLSTTARSYFSSYGETLTYDSVFQADEDDV